MPTASVEGKKKKSKWKSVRSLGRFLDKHGRKEKLSLS